MNGTVALSGIALAALGQLARGSIEAKSVPREKVVAESKAGRVVVEYGRPLFRSELLDRLRPGDVWCFGGGDPTTLRTDVDLLLGDGVLPDGDYRVAARFHGGAAESARWSLVVEDRIAPGDASKPASATLEVPLEYREGGEMAPRFTLELPVVEGRNRLVARFGERSAWVPFVPLERSVWSGSLGSDAIEVHSLKVPCTAAVVERARSAAGLYVGRILLDARSRPKALGMIVSLADGAARLTLRNESALRARYRLKLAERSLADAVAYLGGLDPKDPRRPLAEDAKARLEESVAVERSSVAEHDGRAESTTVSGRTTSGKDTAEVVVAASTSESSLDLVVSAGTLHAAFAIDPKPFARRK